MACCPLDAAIVAKIWQAVELFAATAAWSQRLGGPPG
jgi:hypothetical protein